MVVVNIVQKTSEDWVRNIDNARSEILQLFNRELSMVEAHRTFYRWHIFSRLCGNLWFSQWTGMVG